MFMAKKYYTLGEIVGVSNWRLHWSEEHACTGYIASTNHAKWQSLDLKLILFAYLLCVQGNFQN